MLDRPRGRGAEPVEHLYQLPQVISNISESSSKDISLSFLLKGPVKLDTGPFGTPRRNLKPCFHLRANRLTAPSPLKRFPRLHVPVDT